MNHHKRGLTLRFILAALGLGLAIESYFLSPYSAIHYPATGISSQSNPRDYSSPGWSDNSSNSGGGGWDTSDGGNSGWDSGGGGWDSGGGDSGSWDGGGDSGGGDSGGW